MVVVEWGPLAAGACLGVAGGGDSGGIFKYASAKEVKAAADKGAKRKGNADKRKVGGSSAATAQEASSTTSGGADDDATRRQRRLEKNRESARQSRRRKKQYLELLEEKVQALTK